MSQDDAPLTASGWKLAIGAASSASQPATSTDFHAIYSGEAFGNGARGIVAAVARGVGSGKSAQEAAQIAIHSLVEGYFGAAPTLGAGRAASLALSSVNAWMFGQSRNDPERPAMEASLSALIFVGRHVQIVHVGDCRIYRKRGQELVPLTNEHVRLMPDRTLMLSRSVGGDAEMHTEYLADDSEPSDRYVLLSRGGYASIASARIGELLRKELPPDALARSVVDAAASGEPGEGAATAIVIDVAELPQTSFDEMSAAFAQLPLRGAPREGENWDGFVLGRTLYRSRYTVLKLAQDTLADRQVVLKIPLPFMLQDQVFRAGFLREAWVGATVRSPWIAHYIDIPPERRSSLYLVLPHYRGETLEERLLRPPAMPYLEGVAIGLKLCAAVQDLAASQIIHRDLKPENVILLAGGEIKLLDLGMAYLPGIDAPDDDRLGGTTRYMAPELFRGMPSDQRSEVFSLGVTLYRMYASGAFPFGQRESVPLERLRPDLPSWLGLSLMHAMEMEPGKRYKDASELAAALADGMQRDTAPQPVAGFRQRRIGALGLWRGLAVFFAVLCLILALLLVRARHL